MKYFLILYGLFIHSMAMSATAVLPSDPNQAKAAKEAMEISGFVSNNAASNLSQENVENMLGVASSDSAANFGGDSTNLSVMRTANLRFSCTVENVVSGAGIKVKVVGCNTAVDSLVSIGIEWCKTSNGVNCDKTPIAENLIPGSTKTIESSTLKVNSCQKVNEIFTCEMIVMNRESDSFDGSNLEEVGKDRDDANGNYAYDVIDSYNNNTRLQEIETEVAGLQNYVNNNYEKLNESGDIDVYRNSPEDVAMFGERTGQITVDGVAGGEQPLCSSIDYSNLETCTSNYQVTEFVCPADTPIECTFEREHTVETCTRTLVSNCSSYTDCQASHNGFSGVEPITQLYAANYTLNKSYPIFTYQKLNVGSGYYEGEVKFFITDPRAIKEFTIVYFFADDFLGVRLNNNVVLRGQANAGYYPTGRYPTSYSGGRTYFNDGSSTTSDPTDFYGYPNYNIKDKLVSGMNSLKVHLGVKGGGGFQIQFRMVPYCGCNTVNSWEDVCNAVNY